MIPHDLFLEEGQLTYRLRLAGEADQQRLSAGAMVWILVSWPQGVQCMAKLSVANMVEEETLDGASRSSLIEFRLDEGHYFGRPGTPKPLIELPPEIVGRFTPLELCLLSPSEEAVLSKITSNYFAPQGTEPGVISSVNQVLPRQVWEGLRIALGDNEGELLLRCWTILRQKVATSELRRVGEVDPHICSAAVFVAHELGVETQWRTFAGALETAVRNRGAAEFPLITPALGPLDPSMIRREIHRSSGSDPSKAIERGVREHQSLLAALAKALKELGFEPLYNSILDCAVDLGDVLVIFECKSITNDNYETQLRLGLGQVLDYAHRYALRYPNVTPVVVTDAAPPGAFLRHFQSLSHKHSTAYCWLAKGQFHGLPGRLTRRA